MNFKNKKNIIKMLSLSLVGITIAIPLSSCGYSNNAFNYDANQTPSKDFNNENNNNNNGSSNNSGILDASIVESKKVQNNLSLQQENPNDFGLTQNYLDFANNGSFNKYLGDKSIIYEDILGYLNFLYYKNNKQISFTNSNIKDLKFLEVDASNKLILNKSKISFELVVTVSTNELSEFVIGDKKFNLAKDHSSTLIIKSVDQTLKPTIEKQGEKFYLGWFLDKVSVSFNNQDFEILNFKPTANSFSKAFYFSFNNLSDKQSYFDLKEKYQKDFENQISNESVKKDLEEKINSETALYFDYMDIANNLINEIATDQPVNYLVQKASVYLIDIVTKIGIIPQGIDAILKEAIKIDGSNKSLTLLEVIVNNKEKILSILKSYLGSAYDIVEPLLINLQINMKEDNPSYKLLLEYVNQFVGKDDPIRKLITGDILGVTSSAKSLFDIVWSNIETILNKIKEATQNDKTLTSLINLLTIIFTKDSTSNQFVSIYDSLFKSKETKQKFINSIVSLLPANISEYLNILIIDNSAVNKELMLKITKSFANFFKGLYEHKSDADDTTSFDQRYKNLSFTKTWVTSPTVTKKDVITTTFNYEIKASIINAVDLDIKPIKEIITQDAFNKIVKKLANLTGVVATVAESQIYPELRKHLLNYVPDVFKFGTNGENTNALIFTYSGKDEQIWFNLDKKGIDFYLGLSIGYNLNIFYDDPQLWKNIASSNNFNKEVFETTKTVALIVKVNFKFWYYNFWKSILQNVLMRSYDINSRFYISDYSTKIADYSNYNENYYYTNLSFVNNANQVNVSEIKTLFDLSKTGNFKDQVSTIKNDKVQNPNTLNWGNKATEEVKGITPLTSESNLKTIKEKMFSLTTNNSSFILTKYNLDYSFNTLFNFLAKIEFQVKASVGNVDVHPIISFNISMFKSNLYFPVNFYDETNKKLITNFEKTYSDISFNAQL